MPKYTVKDLFDLKGKKQLTELLVTTPDEAKACEIAGIDMLVTGGGNLDQAKAIREAAPNTFLTLGIPYGSVANATEAVKAGFALLKVGADAVYAAASMDFIKAMSQEGIPVVGHVGLIPSKNTWTGGFKAVGKTADEALKVYQHTVAHQEAGAIAVEMEVVPHQIAAEISKRVDLIVISMGSGAGCDAQYLFAMDILQSHTGHIPRHAKIYRNFVAEYERLQNERIAAFQEFQADVDSGAFPDGGRIVEADEAEFEKFMTALDQS